jgi:hypothetical protein
MNITEKVFCCVEVFLMHVLWSLWDKNQHFDKGDKSGSKDIHKIS